MKLENTVTKLKCELCLNIWNPCLHNFQNEKKIIMYDGFQVHCREH